MQPPYSKGIASFSGLSRRKLLIRILNVIYDMPNSSRSDSNSLYLKAPRPFLFFGDPPYYGRYVDYYNGWTQKDEEALFDALLHTPAHFILSTWHHNEYRNNEMINRFWNHFNVETKDHFYHGGGRLENRHAIVEALVFNFELQEHAEVQIENAQQELNFAV